MNTFHKEANETKFTPIPDPEDGKGWNAQVEELKPRAIKTKDGEEKFVLDITWVVLDVKVKTATGMEKPSVRQTVWLDFTKENALDFGKGKNVQLGRIREALGQNKAGKSWKPSDMMGRLAQVITKQRPDADDPELIYNDVKKVLAA